MHDAHCACCSICNMCSHRVQKQGVVRRRSTTSAADLGEAMAPARPDDREGPASAEGRICTRLWRPDHGYPMGISGRVGGVVPHKHYCSGRGVVCAILAVPGGRCSRASGWPISGYSLARCNRSKHVDACRPCSRWSVRNVPPNNAGGRKMVINSAFELRAYSSRNER